ncbi:CHAT domain-containing protein [Streptomyces sp. TRM S81-3]|uniref:CHAT domain-containing protein n=2 Tax=Streptomyces griseicoloratus TaxID=2752516 RepID=A0A926QVV4_9ACTN|nr:CHAT domain-containing protein [Streptomyces griseicoloratus]
MGAWPPAGQSQPGQHPPGHQWPSGRRRSADALDALCDWAGRAVMGPLLHTLPRGLGEAASLVLVPVGPLGMVPWHAARLPGAAPEGPYSTHGAPQAPHRSYGSHGSRGASYRTDAPHGTRSPRAPRYACQEARISYIPSARLLCEVAARPAPPATGPGPSGGRPALVVGDPTGDLRNAAAEARAIRGAFCPDAPLLDERTGTPEAVLRWLRRQRGGLLHLACHGRVEHGERHTAHLALAGGRLTAEELAEDGGRFPGPELVVLAACSTNVSGRGYDEAYSLATAFLVAGARSVLGSLWPVPDEATSLLMYMAHHYLHTEGLRPGAALRRAQLWMLDERRVTPPQMPAGLAERARYIDRDDLAGWAGFTHLGW